MHTSRNIRNAGTISIYLLFCNPVKIYEVWSMKCLRRHSVDTEVRWGRWGWFEGWVGIFVLRTVRGSYRGMHMGGGGGAGEGLPSASLLGRAPGTDLMSAHLLAWGIHAVDQMNQASVAVPPFSCRWVVPFENTELPSGSERIWCSWLARLSVLVINVSSVLARVWSDLHSKIWLCPLVAIGRGRLKACRPSSQSAREQVVVGSCSQSSTLSGGREGGVLKQCCSWPSGYL